MIRAGVVDHAVPWTPRPSAFTRNRTWATSRFLPPECSGHLSYESAMAAQGVSVPSTAMQCCIGDIIPMLRYYFGGNYSPTSISFELMY